jgi:hypothetical protein
MVGAYMASAAAYDRQIRDLVAEIEASIARIQAIQATGPIGLPMPPEPPPPAIPESLSMWPWPYSVAAALFTWLSRFTNHLNLSL